MKTMVDMKMSKADQKSDQAALTSPASNPYPYGLNIHLDKDELAKLGFSELSEVGQEFYIMALGKVTSVNQSASEGGGDSSSMSIQITEMCMDSEPMHKGEKTETRKAETREKGAKTVLSNAYQGT